MQRAITTPRSNAYEGSFDSRTVSVRPVPAGVNGREIRRVGTSPERWVLRRDSAQVLSFHLVCAPPMASTTADEQVRAAVADSLTRLGHADLGDRVVKGKAAMADTTSWSRSVAGAIRHPLEIDVEALHG